MKPSQDMYDKLESIIRPEGVHVVLVNPAVIAAFGLEALWVEIHDQVSSEEQAIDKFLDAIQTMVSQEADEVAAY